MMIGGARRAGRSGRADLAAKEAIDIPTQWQFEQAIPAEPDILLTATGALDGKKQIEQSPIKVCNQAHKT
jgi:hypothetical protein